MIVGRPHHILVVLDDDHRIARVAQLLRGCGSAARCRAGAGRWKARREYKARAPASSRSAWPGGCAGSRRPTANATNAPARGSPARRRSRKRSRSRISLTISWAIFRSLGEQYFSMSAIHSEKSGDRHGRHFGDVLARRCGN